MSCKTFGATFFKAIRGMIYQGHWIFLKNLLHGLSFSNKPGMTLFSNKKFQLKHKRFLKKFCRLKK